MSTIKRHRPLELPGYCLARGASEKGRKNASGSLAGHRGHRRSHRSSSRARVIPWPGSSCVSAGTVSHWSTGSWRSDHSRRYILWPPWTVPDEDTLASVCTSVRVRGHAGWKSRPAIIYALVICHNRRPPPLCNLTISLRSNGNAYQPLPLFLFFVWPGNATTVICLWIK